MLIVCVKNNNHESHCLIGRKIVHIFPYFFRDIEHFFAASISPKLRRCYIYIAPELGSVVGLTICYYIINLCNGSIFLAASINNNLTPSSDSGEINTVLGNANHCITN